MPNTREKLMELLCDALEDGCIGHCNYPHCFKVKNTADRLIANGVTVHSDKDINVPSKWISVKDRLPEKITNKVITLSKNGYVGFGHYENYKGKQTWYNLESDMPFTAWNYDDDDSYEVTHWQPLPEPPKGE